MFARTQENQLKELTAKINNKHEQCQADPAMALFSACAIGNLLLQIKVLLSGPQWQKWLEDCCSFSEATAQTYMQIAAGDSRLSAPKNWVQYFSDTEAANLEKLAPKKEVDEAIIVPVVRVEDSSSINAREKTGKISLKPTSKLTVKKESDRSEISNSPPKSVEVKKEALNKISEPEQKAKKFVFYIPGNVVPKARPRVTSKGTYLPPKYRQWRNMAEVEIYRQVLDMNLTEELPIKKAAISLSFCGKHRTNSDLDNMAGACLDALTLNGAGVLKDDRLSCIPQLNVEYIGDDGETGVWITIKPIE